MDVEISANGTIRGPFHRIQNGQQITISGVTTTPDINGVQTVENATDEEQPMDMRPSGDDGLNWSMEIPLPDPERDRLHLVALSMQTFYFGDVATKFTSSEIENEY